MAGVLWFAAPASLAEPAAAPAAPAVAPPNIPSLDFKPTKHDIDHYWEFYYFHKAGVSYDRALADLDECHSYSRMLVATSPVPKFIPLGTQNSPYTSDELFRRQFDFQYRFSQQYGLFGGLTAALIAEIATSSVNHGVERSNLRRCMYFKGYSRYGLNKSLWKQLNEATGKDEERGKQIIARFATIASGPAPQMEAIAP
jgi:hypothetical protein